VIRINKMFAFGRSTPRTSNAFVGTRPRQGGGGCAGGQPQIPNCTPDLTALPARGLAPVLFAYCDDDIVLDPGRTNDAWVPPSTVEEFFNRAAVFAPDTPLRARGVIGESTSGLLTLQLKAPRPAGFDLTSPNYRGVKYLIPGITMSFSTSNNTPPGDIEIIPGPSTDSEVTTGKPNFFENFSQYTQDALVQPGHIGLSRYCLLFTNIVSGMTYPELVLLQTDVMTAPPGVSFAVTTAPSGTTGITFTDGIRDEDTLFTVTFKGIDGTGVTIESLGPVSQLWDWAQASTLSALRSGG
jgi:hypothetical protein